MQQTKSVNFGESGLTTVGYTLYAKDGSEYQARTETGVTELGTSGVYVCSVDIPELFDGTLLWDNGNSEPYYAGESFNNINLQVTGDVLEKCDLILASLAMHRSEVEPIIAKLEVKKMAKDMEERTAKFEEAIDILKEDIEKKVGELKNEIYAVGLEEKSIMKIQEVLKMFESMSSDYKQVLNGLNRLDETLSKKVDDNGFKFRARLTSDMEQLNTSIKRIAKPEIPIVEDNRKKYITKMRKLFGVKN